MDFGFNFSPRMLFMKKQQFARVLALSSVALLVACGGGGGGGGAGTTTLNGVALKGPLNAAIACADENEDGICQSGEPQVRTASDGTFTLSLTKSVPILVVTDASTKDDRGNAMAEGTVLKAPAGSTVVSVATTMIAAGATNDQVATALGYPSGTDFKTLNPFKTGGTAADKYKFETSAMQVYTAISAIASGASTGASSNAAFDNAFKALADKAKVASGSIDLSTSSELDDLVTKTKTKMTGVTGFDDTKFEAARADLKNAVANVNTKIRATTVDNFQSSDTSSLYAIATKSVSDQITSRIKDDAPVTLAASGADFDAVLAEQKKVASTTVAKVSDMVGFWEGTLANTNASAILLSDGVAWVVVNDTEPRVIKATLKVNGGMLSGSGASYPTGSATKTAVSMSASLDGAKLVGSVTDTKRTAFELSAPNASPYATAATLASFAKTWTTVSAGRTIAWTFSDAGILTGSSVTTGCTYTGKLSLRSEAKAIVDAQVVEKCDGLSDVTLNGIAYINSTSHAVFTLLSTSGAVLLRF